MNKSCKSQHNIFIRLQQEIGLTLAMVNALSFASTHCKKYGLTSATINPKLSSAENWDYVSNYQHTVYHIYALQKCGLMSATIKFSFTDIKKLGLHQHLSHHKVFIYAL